MGALGAFDVVTLVCYFVALGSIGLSVTRKQAKARQTGEGYFLAERSVGWWAVSASLFASNIGAEHFVGLTGLAAYSGIAVGFYEWGAVLCLLVLGYLFLPVYVNSNVPTMPKWLEVRYSPFCAQTLVWISLVLYILTKIAATLLAGELLLTELFPGMPTWLAVLLLIVGTAVYTMTGGLAAVIYTEALQTVILLGGGAFLSYVAASKVGGYRSFFSQVDVDPELPPHYFNLFRPVSDPDFPWTGLWSGYFVTSLWYWCNDQVIVQRAIAAKTVQHGRAGCVGACGLKLLPGFLMVIPGMIARDLMTDQGVLDKDSSRSEYDRAFTWLVLKCLPINSRGLLLAAMVSALMSSLASVFNSCSTIFTFDIYKKYKSNATEKELVWMGRLVVVAVACLSAAWLPVIPLLGDQLFLWIQKPPSYFAPPIFSLYLWGCLVKALNAKGAVSSLVVGLCFGIVRFLLEILTETGILQGEKKSLFLSMNFLHFSFLNFVLSSAVLLAVSYAFPEANESGRDIDQFMFRLDLYKSLRLRAVYEFEPSFELVRLNNTKDSSAGVPLPGDEKKNENQRGDYSTPGEQETGLVENSAEVSEGAVDRKIRSSNLWSIVIHASTLIVLVLFFAIIIYFK